MEKIRLNIGGEKGNAYYIMGQVKGLCMAVDKREKILAEMTSGDYNNLLRVFKENFPFVELYAYGELPVDDELYTIDNSTIEL